MKFPYWRQTSPASCGPSCLLMVFNHLRPSYGLNREKEWEIWRDSSLLAWRGTHPYGLALAAINRGFTATLYREKGSVWKDPNFPETNESLRYSIGEQGRLAKMLGLVEETRKIDLKLLKDLLDRHIYPIVMVKQIKKNKTLGVILHWVVPTKIDDKDVTFHDSEVSKSRRVPMKLFSKALDAVPSAKWGTSKELLIIGI